MRIEDVVIKPYTLMCMVGPTGSGKSFWVEKLKERYAEVRIVSSDKERAEILGIKLEEKSPEYRYSQEMSDVSKAAFDILFSKVRSYCLQGIRHILVDCTGTKMTTEVLGNIADKFGYEKYAVTMDLSNKEMERYSINTSIFRKSLDKYKKESLLNLKGWTRCNIKERGNFPIILSEEPLYLEEFFVVGDIHQEVRMAKELISQIDKKPIIFIGDYFDTKSKENREESVEETLNFLEQMVDRGNILLKGNHENYIDYRIEGGEPCDVEKEFFNSVSIFLNNESFKERFIKLFEVMPDYLRVVSKGKRYEITHAPTGIKYRCKPHHSNYNFKWRLPEDPSEVYKELSFINDGAQVYTIHGHVHHDGETMTPYRGRFFIDTGAAMGGALSGVYCSGNKVKSQKVGEYNKAFPSLRPPKELSPEMERRVNIILNGGSKFISGTMSPAPSMNGELESLEGALEFFREKGIEDVIVDRKHMGSRCNVYISEEEVLFTSRSGLPIRLDLSALEPKMQDMRRRINCKELVLDGELMPWSCLGEGLVREYESKLWIYERMNEIGFCQRGIEETKKVLSKFSSREDPYFIPFTILKIDWGNKGIEYPEWDWDSICIKLLLQDESCIVTSTNNIEEIKIFFDILIEEGLEGIVLKPINPEDKVKIPYMKVRGRDYLRLVYGPDWTSKEEELCKYRNINKKVDISKKEWNLGKLMISSPPFKIKEYMVEMLGYISKEESLDPRL